MAYRKNHVSRKFQFANFSTRIVAGYEDIHNTRETEAFAIIVTLSKFIQPIPHHSTASLSITKWWRHTTRWRLNVIRHQFIRARRSVLKPHNDALWLDWKFVPWHCDVFVNVAPDVWYVECGVAWHCTRCRIAVNEKWTRSSFRHRSIN